MKSRSLAIVVLILVLPVISCSRGPKYEFPLVRNIPLRPEMFFISGRAMANSFWLNVARRWP